MLVFFLINPFILFILCYNSNNFNSYIVINIVVAAIFSDFFHHEGFLDVVPSDVVAGILLVRFQQRIDALKVSFSFSFSLQQLNVYFCFCFIFRKDNILQIV